MTYISLRFSIRNIPLKTSLVTIEEKFPSMVFRACFSMPNEGLRLFCQQCLFIGTMRTKTFLRHTETGGGQYFLRNIDFDVYVQLHYFLYYQLLCLNTCMFVFLFNFICSLVNKESSRAAAFEYITSSLLPAYQRQTHKTTKMFIWDWFTGVLGYLGK